MEFYIVVFVFFLFLSASGLFGYSRPSPKSMIFLIFMLGVFVALRFEVGSDWENYRNYYYTGIAEDKASGETDIGFAFLRKICYSLGFSHVFFFYLISVSSLLAIYKAALLFKVENIYIVFLVYLALFFCNFQFNIVRNGAMASFSWLAFAYKATGSTKRAWVWALVACSLHIVGLVFIPMMLLIDRKWSRKFIIFVLGTGIVLFILKFGQRLISLFPILSIIDRVSGYVDSDRNEGYGLSIGLIFNIALFLYFFLKYRNEYDNNTPLRVSLNAMLVNIFLCLSLNTFETIVARIGQPLNMASLFIWPFLLYHIRKKPYKIIISFFLLFYLSLYYYKSWGTENAVGETPMLPYKMELSQVFEKK